MRKIPVIIILSAFLALTQGCALKHSIGYVSNELVWRQSFGDVKTQVSLGGSVNNSFADAVTDDPGLYYKQEETGGVVADAWLGLGVFYRIFKNDIFDLSAGIKFRNNFRADYNYLYYYEAYTGLRSYHYDEEFVFNYFSANKLSLMLPDVEIKSPFSDNIKFTFSLELVYLKWFYNGGKYVSTFRQDVSTIAIYSEESKEIFEAIGAVNSVEAGSGLTYFGAINLGILYYF